MNAVALATEKLQLLQFRQLAEQASLSAQAVSVQFMPVTESD